MMWTWPSRRNPGVWREMDRLQQEMNRLFEPFVGRGARPAGEFPAVNIWTGDDTAILTAELPGVDPTDIDVSIKENVVTIRGNREADTLPEGHTHIRRERGTGRFVRAFSLPFPVDAGNVTAEYRLGILQVALPRAEADKPRKITVNAG